MGVAVTEPMYWRIAQELRHAIESGTLRPGDKLLTESELKDQYRASRNTVRDAIKWLTHRALVETRPGQGTFVVKHPDILITTLSADPESRPGSENGAAASSQVSNGSRAGYASSPEGPVPFRLTVSVFPADRNQFVINFGEVPVTLVAPGRPGS